MSAITAVFHRDGGSADPSVLRNMLGQMRSRGADRSGVQVAAAAGLGVARYDWEFSDSFSGSALLVEEHGCTVAADASLYYRDQLRAQLKARRITPGGASPSHLILAAYRAWGERCVEYLEGDFAFILWDAPSGKLMCARDPVGSRTLYYADLGSAVVLASSSEGVLDHPNCPRRLNIAMIAELSSNLYGVGDESCYSAVSQVEAGEAVTFEGVGVRRERFWEPPEVTPFRRASLEEGAEELKELLSRAVGERMDADGPTSVWMSGGRDSTAIYGAGMHQAARHGNSPGDPRAVSLSYPRGNPGREDEHIRAVTKYWGASPYWIDYTNVPLLESYHEGAGARADAFPGLRDPIHRELSLGSRAVSSRLALTGGGGDALFLLSPAYMSDLFYRGLWISCAAEWRAKRARRNRARTFYGWVLHPGMPEWLSRAIAFVRGPEIEKYSRGPSPAPWLRQSVLEEHGIPERQERYWSERRPRGVIAREAQFQLTHPAFPRVIADISDLALTNGVEVRQPFYDRRVIEFALSRSWREKYQGTERKLVLRRSMRDLLPPEVLENRQRRTGTCDPGLEPHIRATISKMILSMSGDLALADLGIVEPSELLGASEEYEAGGARRWAPLIVQTLQAELWLRRREGVKGHRDTSPTASPPVVMERGAA